MTMSSGDASNSSKGMPIRCSVLAIHQPTGVARSSDRVETAGGLLGIDEAPKLCVNLLRGPRFEHRRIHREVVFERRAQRRLFAYLHHGAPATVHVIGDGRTAMLPHPAQADRYRA